MQYTKIRLIGLQQIDLPIVGATLADPYICKGVDGLGPAEVDVFIANPVNQGAVYQGRQPQNREIVALVGLTPNYSTGQTSESLRQNIYGLLSPGPSQAVTVQFLNGSTVVATTTAYVKKIEAALFSKDPAVQITLACLGAYFQAPANVSPDLVTLSKSTPIIANSGDAETGFYMEIRLTDDIPDNWWIQDSQGNKLQFNNDFYEDDLIKIDTRPGQRSAFVQRIVLIPVDFTLLPNLSSTSKWLQLYGGVNTFTTSSPDFNWETFLFKPLYWGV